MYGDDLGLDAIEEPDREPEQTNTACYICGCALGLPGGYANSGLCGPCCTGEAETIEEVGETW